MTRKVRRMWIAAAVLVGGAALPAGADSGRLTLRALAVNMSNVGGRGAESVDIVIERWSGEDEHARLRDALLEKGPDGLMDALQDNKRAGYIRPGNGGLGWDVHYARRIPLPGGGYRVVFATDRPMSFQELWRQPRSADYDFMVGELRVGPDGKGEGKVVPRAKIDFDKEKGVIEIENYASEPVRLTSVRQVEPKVAASN